MDYIRKIPFILGTAAAVIVGLISFDKGMSLQETYMRMVIGLIIFYIIGAYIRNTVNRIMEEQEKRVKDKEERDKKEQEERAQEELDQEALKRYEAAVSERQARSAQILSEGFSDEFTPMKVGELLGDKGREAGKSQ